MEPRLNSVARAEAYRHTKWNLDPSSHLATIDEPIIGGLCPVFGEVELCKMLNSFFKHSKFVCNYSNLFEVQK